MSAEPTRSSTPCSSGAGTTAAAVVVVALLVAVPDPPLSVTDRPPPVDPASLPSTAYGGGVPARAPGVGSKRSQPYPWKKSSGQACASDALTMYLSVPAG